jgi:hypothetical protein
MKVKKIAAVWGMGGVEVFVVPRGISLAEVRSWAPPSDEMPNGDSNWEKYHAAWFMEIPDRCVC